MLPDEKSWFVSHNLHHHHLLHRIFGETSLSFWFSSPWLSSPVYRFYRTHHQLEIQSVLSRKDRGMKLSCQFVIHQSPCCSSCLSPRPAYWTSVAGEFSVWSEPGAGWQWGRGRGRRGGRPDTRRTQPPVSVTVTFSQIFYTQTTPSF